MIKKTVLFLAVMALVVTGGFWGGRKACMLMWPGSVNPSGSWYFALGLNGEGAARLKKLESGFRKDADRLCMRICKERLRLLQMIRRNAPREEIHAKIESTGQLQIALEKMIADHIVEVKTQLTAEQSAAYLERIQKELHDSIEKSGYGEILNQTNPVPG